MRRMRRAAPDEMLTMLPCTFAGDHQLGEAARDQERRAQVDVEDAVPFGRVDVDQEAARIDAGIVDHDVGRAPGLADRGDQIVDRGAVGAGS